MLLLLITPADHCFDWEILKRNKSQEVLTIHFFLLPVTINKLHLEQLLSSQTLNHLSFYPLLFQSCNDPCTRLCCYKNETYRQLWISVCRSDKRSIRYGTRSSRLSLQIQMRLLACCTRHKHQEHQITWDSPSCIVSNLLYCIVLTRYLQAYTRSNCISNTFRANTSPKLRASNDPWWEDRIHCTCVSSAISSPRCFWKPSWWVYVPRACLQFEDKRSSFHETASNRSDIASKLIPLLLHYVLFFAGDFWRRNNKKSVIPPANYV